MLSSPSVDPKTLAPSGTVLNAKKVCPVCSRDCLMCCLSEHTFDSTALSGSRPTDFANANSGVITPQFQAQT